MFLLATFLCIQLCNCAVVETNQLSFQGCLGNDLSSSLILPGTGNYTLVSTGDRDRILRKPYGVLLVSNEQDLKTAVNCCKTFGINPVPRCGGHSYESLSSQDGSLTIDLAGMNHIQLLAKEDNGDSALVTVGGGSRLGRVYSEISKFGNYAFNAGVCPTVGIGGHLSGGGYGMLARYYGLAVDQTVGMKVLLSSGEMVNASANENSDLYWALRGGGAGSFGIVTQYTIRVHQPPTSTMFSISFSADVFAQLVRAWMDYFPTSDARLTTQLSLYASGAKLYGRFLGSGIELKNILISSGVFSFGGVVSDMRWENCTARGANAQTAGADGCDVNYNLDPPIYNTNKDRGKYKSEYGSYPMPDAGIAEMLKIVSTGNTTNGEAWVQFEALGGAISNHSVGSTPYGNRESIYSIQYSVPLTPNQYNNVSGLISIANVVEPSDADRLNWIKSLEAAFKPYVNGKHYQNYPDLDLGVNYGSAYYGTENFSRLKEIKRKYDPINFFRNEQSIPLE